jgi:hypothetical protein
LLYAKLANAYRQSGNASKAIEWYVTAAQSFVEVSNATAAQATMKDARSLNVQLTPAIRNRIEQTESAIQQLLSDPKS